MAVSGCEFVCKNKECPHCGSGIVMTSPWPLGDIDKIISSQKVARDTFFKEKLEKTKEQGRKYACIQLPDSEKIPVVGYRVHMWCEKCPCLWTYDALIPDHVKENAMQEAIDNANIPSVCPTCQNKLKTFKELIENKEDGIQCSSCHKKLQKNVWFSNEEGPDEKLNPLIKISPK